jgi:acetyl esterase/lipase
VTPRRLAVPLLLAAAAGCGRQAPSPAAGRSAGASASAAAPVSAPASMPAPPITWSDLAALPVAPADARIAYGDDPLHFAELRLPPGAGPFPVAVLVHGGCWQAAYDVQHVSQLAAALAREGVATWTLEYRRLGDAGGGWPGTFDDVARGIDALRPAAAQHPLDTSRVVLVGHSAGGQLALWAAGPRAAAGTVPRGPALRARGVVSLAGITDLRAYGAAPGGCNASVTPLLGGTPAEVGPRYDLVSPVSLVPLGVPVRLVHGALDRTVPPEQSRDFAERATAAGDDARLLLVDGAAHFDVVAASSAAWPTVLGAVRELLGRP